jgi:uncharacterized protein (DUF3084 family)
MTNMDSYETAQMAKKSGTPEGLDLAKRWKSIFTQRAKLNAEASDLNARASNLDAKYSDLNPLTPRVPIFSTI